jgi:UDP-glucose:(heptosyl)LPS alpha-1,3-glucosyltransferase
MTGGLTKIDRIKRVAVVVPRYGLVGGGEKLVYELTERVATDSRWEIHVFANQWHNGSELIHFHHVPVISFPRFLAPLSFAYFARQKINRLGVDLIHTHERIFSANIYSVHGIPHLIWVKQIRNKLVMGLYDHALAFIEKRLIENTQCKHLLAVSSITAEQLNVAFVGVSGRIRIVSPGIDVSPFMRWQKQECRKALRAEHGWDDDDLVILFVGMNFEIKGLDRIMRAISIVGRADPAGTMRLVVAGKGNTRKYARLAESLGISENVVFTGTIESDIERIYLGCDVFMLLSRFDTFGLVVLEAMAAGLPVIISRHVGAKDVVRDGLNGFVVDGEDLTNIVESLQILSRRGTRDRMGCLAAETARSHSWRVMAQTVSDLYADELNL